MIKKTVFPNGLRLISEYTPETYSATVMFWIDVGSCVEKKELSGISHFIEHMLFKGTKNRTAEQIVQAIECNGGSINAFTEKENTCYYARVLGNQIPVVMDAIFDMVFNSVYKDRDIEIERQVILEEIKMYEDTPDELVFDLLMQSFWKGHPLASPITGIAESVSGITKEDIIEFVENYYIPENIVISIAGNFDEDAVIAQIDSLTSHINKKARVREVSLPVINPEIKAFEKDIEQTHIYMGMRNASILSDGRFASAVIDVCLGGGMASRLFQEIREKRGLVYSINTYESLYRPAGIFGIYAATNPSNVNEVIGLINAEVEKFKSLGLSEHEFVQAKNQLKGSLLIGFESTKYRASKNGRSELYFNRIYTVEELCEAVENVTMDDVNRLSEYIFNDKYMGISFVCPANTAIKSMSLPC